MTFPNLGKLLFPHLPRDLRKRKMRIVFMTLATSLIFSLLLVLWMIRKTEH
jgi:hypothetical protein